MFGVVRDIVRSAPGFRRLGLPTIHCPGCLSGAVLSSVCAHCVLCCFTLSRCALSDDEIVMGVSVVEAFLRRFAVEIMVLTRNSTANATGLDLVSDGVILVWPDCEIMYHSVTQLAPLRELGDIDCYESYQDLLCILHL